MIEDTIEQIQARIEGAEAIKEERRGELLRASGRRSLARRRLSTERRRARKAPGDEVRVSGEDPLLDRVELIVTESVDRAGVSAGPDQQQTAEQRQQSKGFGVGGREGREHPGQPLSLVTQVASGPGGAGRGRISRVLPAGARPE